LRLQGQRVKGAALNEKEHQPAQRALSLSVMQFLLGGDPDVRSDSPSRQPSGESISSFPRWTAEIELRGQWEVVLNLCAEWKLLAALDARLAMSAVAPPPEAAAALARRTQPAFVQTMLCVRAGSIALAALEGAGIPCAGFKGLAALAYLYPSPRSRTLQDTDVLIHPHDVERALAVLETAGFTRYPECPWEEYVAFVRNSPGTAGNEAVSLRDEKGGAVDLHWHLGILDVETLLGGAATVRVLNQTLPLMSARHAMLLSVHHALRNDFVPGDIGRDVCDFARWQPLLAKRSEWPAAAEDAGRWGLSGACGALALIVAELQGAADAAPPLALSRDDRAEARDLASFYFEQLRSGAVNTDLAYVASARPLLQVASGLAGGWSRYRAMMRQFELANGEASPSLGARLWNLVRSLGRLSPNRWRQLRALARAKDRIVAPRSQSANETLPPDPTV
jgi:hypothetical protein